MSLGAIDREIVANVDVALAATARREIFQAKGTIGFAKLPIFSGHDAELERFSSTLPRTTLQARAACRLLRACDYVAAHADVAQQFVSAGTEGHAGASHDKTDAASVDSGSCSGEAP